LICWISVKKLNIVGLHVYMDKFFRWDLASNLIHFHRKLWPCNQVQLLLLWDQLGVPYSNRKQEHGIQLKIISFWIDINLGTIPLTPDSITDLTSCVSDFLTHPDHRLPLHTWQQLTVHLNWCLNVLPWAFPTLSELYRKMQGKSHPCGKIFLNTEVIESFSWFQTALSTAIRVKFINDDCWGNHNADMVVWTDTSLKMAIAFIYANKGFVDSSIKVDIFFLEMIGILSAIHHAASLPVPPKQLLIWSDSLNSVQLHNSLATGEPLHNSVLLAITLIIIKTGIDLRVNHIPGKQNIRANLLSCLLFNFYWQFPSYRMR
ncbi:hypothetical protein B0H10DRAFT_1770596, partial [Mycena sp. CBHHK59/15]